MARNTILTRTAPERVLLLAVTSKGKGKKQSAVDSLEKLGHLADTAGAVVVSRIVQQLPAPSNAYYVGKGKLLELLSLRDSTDYNILILDDELSPNQQHNLEEALKVKVIDRAALILDIFAKRARTHEGRLQVELSPASISSATTSRAVEPSRKTRRWHQH